MSIAPMTHWGLANPYSCNLRCPVMNSSLSLKPQCAGPVSSRSECGSLFLSHLASRLQEWLSRRLEETIPQSVREKFAKLPEE